MLSKLFRRVFNTKNMQNRVKDKTANFVYLKKEIEEIERELWLFTKQWPITYELYNSDNQKRICIVGNANIYDKSSPEAIVQQLARNYETDYVKTRIIMYPNFAIIYEDASEIRLVEFFINNNIPENDKEKALLQIKLALLELQKEGKNINIDQLDNNKKELITSIMNISEEKLDEERGISRGI